MPKAEITASSKLKISDANLTDCSLIEPDNSYCHLDGGNGEEIGLGVAEAAFATGKSPEDTAELAGTDSVKILIDFSSDEECTFFSGGFNPLEGSVTLKLPKGQTEATKQEFVGEGTASKNLKLEKTLVYVTGKLKLKLASGKAWSFH
jgi:hypothetical protein